MTRRPRVPGTKPAFYRREIATGGRPTEAFLRVVNSLPIGRGQLWEASVAHDEQRSRSRSCRRRSKAARRVA